MRLKFINKFDINFFKHAAELEAPQYAEIG